MKKIISLLLPLILFCGIVFGQTTVNPGSNTSAQATAADATSNPSISKIGAYGYGYNGSTWDRIRTGFKTATSTLTGYLNNLPFGTYNATPPTLTDGQSVNLQLNSAGSLRTDPTQFPAGAAAADATANPTISKVGSYLHGYNGSTWDRLRTGLTAVTSTLTGYLNSLPFLTYNSTPPVLTNGQSVNMQGDAAGNLKTTLATTIAGEDITNDVLKVEQRGSYCRKTADGQCKGSGGFLYKVCYFPTTATPTAGLFTIYDSLTESSTPIITKWVFATDAGRCEPVDAVAGTGLFVGYDGTLANVSVTLIYR